MREIKRRHPEGIGQVRRSSRGIAPRLGFSWWWKLEFRHALLRLNPHSIEERAGADGIGVGIARSARLASDVVLNGGVCRLGQIRSALEIIASGRLAGPSDNDAGWFIAAGCGGDPQRG